MVNAGGFLFVGAVSGIYAIAEKVCNQGKMTAGPFGYRVPAPGCQQNTVMALCSFLCMLMSASCVVTPVSPPLGIGLSVICFALMLASTCLGITASRETR